MAMKAGMFSYKALRNKLKNSDPFTRVTKCDVDMCESFFKFRTHPDMAGRVDYLDNTVTLGERREKIRRILNIARNDRHLQIILSYDANKKTFESARCWAVLLTMQWDQLQAFYGILTSQDVTAKQDAFLSFLQACIPVTNLVWWMSETPTTRKEQVWARSERQRNEALKRDNFRCVLTNSAIREVCHIVPFWTLSRRMEIQRDVLQPLRFVLGLEFFHRLMGLMNQQTERGTTEPSDFDLLDSPANMITLSNKLHKLWDDGVFGLEPIARPQKSDTLAPPTLEKPGTGPSAVKRGADTVEHQPPHKMVTKGNKTGKEGKLVSVEKPMYGITLRFHWLQKTTLVGLDDSPPTLDADPRSMWQDWDHDNVRDNEHATPLDNGHIITIWSDDKEKLPNWDLLSVQWLAFRLHRLSGAADVELYAPQKDQDDDEALAARVIQAKRQATEAIAERRGLDPDRLLADPRGPYYVPPDAQPRAD
ncbi:hypothetical protein LX32DRAFT_673871 [Colletotrichum zoysiae]|uniref:HNH nuclease domain-containing protein n=1 Tax=Colletotrichum zoysiae TaxID=1216348 RepID=A0AAD9HGN4_9PEZI|nr:hypothetical protein LX32DRAFT_673871 [Colletotrichum zoysiae]